MFRIFFALFAIYQSSAQPDEVKDALAHAEALYYGARFNESIALLTRIDESLKAQAGSLREKTNTKLRLALSHIGLNDTAKAKSFLMELYALDSDYALDPEQFSPKVIAVAADAKTEQNKIQCYAAQTDARKYMEAGNSSGFLDLVRSLRSKCPVLAAMEPEAAESFYRAGMAAYRRGEVAGALSELEAAVTLFPEHELALQYIDLIQSKMKLSQDRLLLQAEYRKNLTTLVETWNRTCPSGDATAMNAIRAQIAQSLPEPSFGEDIRAQMVVCAEKPVTPAPEMKPEAISITGCLEMQPQLALARLRTRVDPVVTNEMRYYLKSHAQASVRVKVRIAESGDVTVTGMPDGNPIINSVIGNAVAQWKFTPTRDPNGARCVDTEIPILIRVTQP